MPLRRGFKSEAEKRSLRFRENLGLKPYDYLSAKELATFCGIKIFRVDEINGLNKKELDIILSGDLSAIAVVSHSIIIHNHLHAPTRQESDLMHEISHCILNHKSNRVLNEVINIHSYDKIQEEEASWLGGCLQVPRDGLIWGIKNDMTIESLATWFKASAQMIKYRISITGVLNQFKIKH